MKLIVGLLIITLSYVSSEEADCSLIYVENSLNNYITVKTYDQMTISSVSIWKSLTEDTKLSVVCDIFDKKGNIKSEEKIYLCTEPAPKNHDLLEIMKTALGVDLTVCPVEQQTINDPPSSFRCEWDFGAGADDVFTLSYAALRNEDFMFELAVSITKTENDK